ncbi:MAG TPA: hypothetical protein VJH03_21370 [Blastocatellia bacterium]|nr:hypothetical protein [Blastocatellia bacterium]
MDGSQGLFAAGACGFDIKEGSFTAAHDRRLTASKMEEIWFVN